MRKNLIAAFIAGLYCIIALAACSRSSDCASQLLEITADERKCGPLNEFISEYSGCTVLQTTRESLIQSVDKIVTGQGVVYIMDRGPRTVHMFDKESGAWLGKIAKAGRGPEEYVEMSDFDVFEGNIYILSQSDSKLLVYSADGTLLKSARLPFPYTRLKVVGGDSVWLYAEQSNNDLYNFVLFDLAAGQITRRYDSFSKNESYIRDMSPFCGQWDNKLLTAKYFDSCIYAVGEDGYTPFCRLNMHMPAATEQELSEMTRAEIAAAYRYQPLLHAIRYADRKKERMLLVVRGFFEEMGLRNAIIMADLGTGRSSCYIIGEEKDRQFPLFDASTLTGYQDGMFISVIQAGAMKTMTADAPESLDEEDNPVILFHKAAL